MNTSNILKCTISWLPTIPVVFFFLQNALEKVLYPGQLDKMGLSENALILIGVTLMVATVLFLFERTVLIGTLILATYMSIIVFIHALEEKPFLIAILIVLLIILAGFVRMPKFKNLK